MAVISLPLSFTNSFWTQDYRRGLEVLYTKLEQVRPASRSERVCKFCSSTLQGVAENEEIIAFVRVCGCYLSNGLHAHRM